MRRFVPLLIAAAMLTGGLVSCSAAETNEESVILITHDSFSVSEGVLDAFESETGIRVEVLTGADVGTLVTEAVLTRDDPIGDVLYGIDNTFLSRGLDEDLFQSYESPRLDVVPEEFQLDDEHRVTPIDYGDVCVNVAESVTGEAPVGFDDLRLPEYASQWVTENPESSSPGLAIVLATIATYGEDGWEAYWADVAANDLAVTSSWTDAYYGDFVAGGGDRSLVTSYASSPVAEVVFAETPISAPTTTILPSTCFRQVEFAGILTNAEHPDAARKLIDFLLSDTFQNDVPLSMFVYPVTTTATLPDVFVEHATTVEEPLRLDPDRIGEMRDTWTERWVEIVLR